MELRKLLRVNGLAWAVESAKYVAALLYKVELCDNRIEKYPEEAFYSQNSPRKAWVERRNEAINLALDEILVWNEAAGLQLVKVPSKARPWEENISEQVQAVVGFLSVQKAVVALGGGKVA